MRLRRRHDKSGKYLIGADISVHALGPDEIPAVEANLFNISLIQSTRDRSGRSLLVFLLPSVRQHRSQKDASWRSFFCEAADFRLSRGARKAIESGLRDSGYAEQTKHR
jgi:hypothetical protein